MPTTSSPLGRTHVISCIGIDQEYELLAHFLDHYRSLGVPANNFHIILHTWTGNAERITNARSVFATRGLADPSIWTGHWSAEAHWERRRLLQTDCVPAGHWVLHADADEMQEYPTDLGRFLQYCEQRRINCVQGPLIDRVTRDGTLAPVSASEALEKTFPVQADVRYAVGWKGQHYGMSGTIKIMATTSDVFARKGGHRVSLEQSTRLRFLTGRSLDELSQLRNPSFRFYFPLKVHHYKWNTDLSQLLAERRRNTHESKASQEFTSKLSNYLASRRRIDINQIPVARGDASRIPWRLQIRAIRTRARVRPLASGVLRRLNLSGKR